MQSASTSTLPEGVIVAGEGWPLRSRRLRLRLGKQPPLTTESGQRTAEWLGLKRLDWAAFRTLRHEYSWFQATVFRRLTMPASRYAPRFLSALAYRLGKNPVIMYPVGLEKDDSVLPEPTAASVDATIAYCEYVYRRYTQVSCRQLFKADRIPEAKPQAHQDRSMLPPHQRWPTVSIYTSGYGTLFPALL